MKRILLERHSGTEVKGSSLYRFFSTVEKVLGKKNRLYRMSRSVLDGTEKFPYQYYQCDVAILTNPYILSKLRENMDWKGVVLFFALGSLPRGGKKIRAALPFLKSSDIIVVSCSSDLKIYRKLIKSGGPQVKLLPFPVDSEHFKPLSQDLLYEIKSGLGITSSNVITYVGRITLEKNVHRIIEVFSQILKNNPDTTLVICGNYENESFVEFGIEVGDIRKIINKYILYFGIPKNNIKILPHQDDDILIQIYNISDIILNLSLHHDENFGYSQAEAMSCGKAVVATEWGGFKDTILHGQTGFLIPTWLTDNGLRIDWFKCVCYVNVLLQNQNIKKKMGEKARERVTNEYSYLRFETDLHSLIEKRQNLCPTSIVFTEMGYNYYLENLKKIKHNGCLMYIPSDPRYSSYSDIYYKYIITPYTSERKHDTFSMSDYIVRTTNYLNIEKNKVYYNDPMWPSIISISDPEERILRLLGDNEPLQISKLPIDPVYLNNILFSLWRKGLIIFVKPGIYKMVRCKNGAIS